MFFSPKTFYPIGLDISDLSIKLIQLAKIRDKIKIIALGQIDLAPGIIDNGSIKNEEKLGDAISNLISGVEYGRVQSGEVIACLPESLTFIKLIEVEKRKNPEEFMREEIEKQIPFSADDLYYDFQFIEHKDATDFYLIGAAPKSSVDKLAAIFDRLKLSVVALEIEPVSVCRALLAEEGLAAKRGECKNYCVLDIGARHASLTIYGKYSILFSLSLPFPGDEVTDIIAEKVKLSRDQAEKAKIICGLDSNEAEGAVKKILTDELKRLTERIKEGIEFYSDHYPGYGPISKIILAGGAAYIKALPKLLKEELKIETALGDPFINFTGSKNADSIYVKKYVDDFRSKSKKLSKNGYPISGRELSYATAMGLALRDIFIDDL